MLKPAVRPDGTEQTRNAKVGPVGYSNVRQLCVSDYRSVGLPLNSLKETDTDLGLGGSDSVSAKQNIFNKIKSYYGNYL